MDVSQKTGASTTQNVLLCS